MTFSTFSSVWAGIATFLVSVFQELVAIFYTAGTGSTPGSLTIIGYFAVISIGVGLVLKVYHMIKGFIKGI